MCKRIKKVETDEQKLLGSIDLTLEKPMIVNFYCTKINHNSLEPVNVGIQRRLV